MARIVVTGGAGFIGSHTCESLLELGHTVFCIDNFNDYYEDSTGRSGRFKERKDSNVAAVKRTASLRNGNFQAYRADITDRNALTMAWPADIDAVVHLAARAGVRKSLDDPEKTYPRTNINGTRNVVELAHSRGVRRFSIASSSSVYGTCPSYPWSEETPLPAPVSPYAETKQKMETWVKGFSDAHEDAAFAVLRFFTVYGPRGRPDMAPYKFIDRIWRGEEIERYGDGKTIRDYTDVGDIVDGIVRSLHAPNAHDVFNLGNHRPVSLNDFIQVCEEVTDRKARIRELPPQPGDVPATYADNAKARSVLGWEPRTPVLEGMARLAEWYWQHEST